MSRITRVNVAREGLDLAPGYTLCKIGALKWDLEKPYEVTYGLVDSAISVGKVFDLQREESGLITAKFEPFRVYSSLKFDENFKFMAYCSTVKWADELVDDRRVVDEGLIRSIICIVDSGWVMSNGVGNDYF